MIQDALQYTSLEKEVLTWLLSGDDPVLEELRRQIASASIKSREYTGVGIYLNFDMVGNNQRTDVLFGTKSRFCFGDVGARIGSERQDVGFLLWVIDGHLSFLEGYAYGDEKWPTEIKEFNLYYFDDRRNINDLRRNWMQ